MYQPQAHWLRSLLALSALSLATPLLRAQTAPAAVPAAPSAPAPPALSAPAVDSDAASYSIGLVFGSQLHSNGLDNLISLDAVMRGFKEGLAGTPLGPEDKDRAVQLMRSGREATAARNRAAARDFLAKNGAAPGVTTTASGLQYQAIEAGDAKAASATMSDRVTVHYRGRLLDGTEFDSSDSHPQAATFGLNGVIKGWREALLLMKPGAKWRLFIPPELAYDMSSPPTIPPGSLLIFDVELVKVEPPPVMSGQGAKAPAARKPGVKKPAAKQAPPAAPGQ